MRWEIRFWKEGEVILCGAFYRGHDRHDSIWEAAKYSNYNMKWNDAESVALSARQRTTNWTRKEEVEELDKLVRAQSEFLFRFFSEFDKLAIICATWDTSRWNTTKKRNQFSPCFICLKLEVNWKPLQCRQLWGRLKVDVFISRNTCWHRRDS